MQPPFLSLYSWTNENAVRDSLGTGFYFMTYESSKQLLTTFGGDNTHSNPLAVLVAGGLCGIVSWAMICKSFTISDFNYEIV